MWCGCLALPGPCPRSENRSRRILSGGAPDPDRPFRALWTALCAPVDLPLNRWLPMYAILAAGLVILLVLLFFIGRAVGIARSRRRPPDHPAQMEPPQSRRSRSLVPEPVPERSEAPPLRRRRRFPVIVPKASRREEAPAPGGCHTAGGGSPG